MYIIYTYAFPEQASQDRTGSLRICVRVCLCVCVCVGDRNHHY